MAPILLDVSRLTGLDNYNLYVQAKVDTNTVKMIDGFLRQLPAPVWFVYHNGVRFDFPLNWKSKNNILLTTSFSLINLDQEFFGYQPEISHGADADCLTLLKVTAVLGAELIAWVEDNYYKFKHCNAMWNMLWLSIKQNRHFISCIVLNL
jgi:hypothetical protein